MTTFRFNFSTETDDKTETDKDDKEDLVPAKKIQAIESSEIFPCDEIINEIDDLVDRANMFTDGELEIGYIHSKDAPMLLQESGKVGKFDSISDEENVHWDLIEGIYEGGFKVWECTFDLAKYINGCEDISFENSTVLDLGCGMGILGIIALMKKARVHFQDYVISGNEEVLIGATIPNVLLNLPDDDKSIINKNCRFFSGDWSSLDNLMEKKPEDFQYDYILTSETIYNTQNYSKIHNLIKNRLKNTGKAFVAAKSHYFGVGGNMREFESFVKKHDFLESNICWKSGGGFSREIMKLSLK